MGFDLLCMGDQGLTIGQSALNKSQGKRARPGHSPGFIPATTGWNVHSFSNQTRWTPNFSVEFDNDSLSRLSELNESHLRFGHKMVSLEDIALEELSLVQTKTPDLWLTQPRRVWPLPNDLSPFCRKYITGFEIHCWTNSRDWL